MRDLRTLRKTKSIKAEEEVFIAESCSSSEQRVDRASLSWLQKKMIYRGCQESTEFHILETPCLFSHPNIKIELKNCISSAKNKHENTMYLDLPFRSTALSLVACTQLYKLLRRSVCWLVCPSVTVCEEH